MFGAPFVQIDLARLQISRASGAFPARLKTPTATPELPDSCCVLHFSNGKTPFFVLQLFRRSRPEFYADALRCRPPPLKYSGLFFVVFSPSFCFCRPSPQPVSLLISSRHRSTSAFLGQTCLRPPSVRSFFGRSFICESAAP